MATHHHRLHTQLDNTWKTMYTLSSIGGSVMGSGSTRPNNADDKMIAAIERGNRDDFKDRKPTKITDKKLIKEKEARTKKSQEKTEKLKALRLAAEKEGRAK
jgi:hypothetical protein